LQKKTQQPYDLILLEIEGLGLRDQLALLSKEEDQEFVRSYKSRVTQYFPFDGPNRNVYKQLLNYSLEFPEIERDFLRKVLKIAQVDLQDLVVVLWDEMSYPALKVPLHIVVDHIDVFLTVQDTYIIPLDTEWCVCFKSGAGDIGFGLTKDVE